MQSEIMKRENAIDGASNGNGVASATLDEILITDELAHRPLRSPDYAAENRALVSLAECMTQAPEELLQLLTDLAVELCQAGSAGISLIQQDDDEGYFSWVAMSGLYAPYVGSRTPLDFSPCGATLERSASQLFYYPERVFTYFRAVTPSMVEGLVVPFAVDHQYIGTIWVAGHDDQRHFDAEDVRVMTSLARFTGAAIQMKQLLEVQAETNLALQVKIAEHQQAVKALRKSEADLLELNNTLEQRVLERTEELQRSNQELDQFAYVASHDLRAPLRAIGQLASWIAEDTDALLPAASKVHLAKLSQRVKRIETLLEDLLAYSRAGRRRHPVEPVDVNVLLADVTDTLMLPPNFIVKVMTPLPLLMTERIPLETAFRNLIGNAIKHHSSPSHGSVEVRCQDHGEVVEFMVKDDGPGIDPQYHKRIFEMFQTLRPRDEVEGSGIGLAVLKKIVESRGGNVEVDSNLGDGATFCFTWPKSMPS